jgi:Ca-activated chloride channel homolog
MTGRLVLLNAAVIASLCPAPVGAAWQDQPGRTTFRSAIDVVSVSAVVRDRKGRFVSNLEQADFVIAEGGESRPILDFRAQSDGPVKLAVLFDISGSMRLGSKAADARQAARHLFSALKPGDEAAVFAFDTRLDRVSGFTTDLPALEAALGRVEQPFGQTSLYDAIAETARAVALASGGDGRIQQRSAIVVLTDGVDTRSRQTAEQVSSIASGIDIPVYIVAVMSPIDDPRREGALPQTDGPLTNLARWTGGEFFTTSAPAHASVAARQIVEELRHQYLLAFEASTHPGWRPLEVRARDSDLTVRARAGYRVEGTIGAGEMNVEQTTVERMTVPLARRSR